MFQHYTAKYTQHEVWKNCLFLLILFALLYFELVINKIIQILRIKEEDAEIAPESFSLDKTKVYFLFDPFSHISTTLLKELTSLVNISKNCSSKVAIYVSFNFSLIPRFISWLSQTFHGIYSSELEEMN